MRRVVAQFASVDWCQRVRLTRSASCEKQGRGRSRCRALVLDDPIRSESQGYEPKNIGSTGHSIGGTLAVMLPLRLLAKGEATPGAIVSVSPWTDLTLQNASVGENEKTDKMLSRGTLELFRAAWLQDPAVDVADPQVSLVNADLTGLPPTVVYYGEYETLADDGARLGRLLADFKVTSEVHPMPEGQHSFILGAGRVPEVDQSIRQMGQWLRRHLGA
ncbi:alpha/beta hydrolase [Actinomadura sp. GTD37]|uniref:alpha/beta hydrolase n=1 Tax=Actinomadura sp. GTD37 TaxID=1778030 RepID=UPI0035C24AAF